MSEILLLTPHDPESLVGVVVKGQPPRGLCSLASTLKGKHSITINDNVKAGDIPSIIAEHAPIVVGVSVASPLAFQAKLMIDEVREAKPDCVIVVGGPHVTASSSSFSFLGADYGLAGECEHVFPSFIECILEGASPGSRGLVTVDGGFPDSLPIVADLDGLEMPDFSLLELSGYGSLPIESARGCPFDCVYCSEPSKSRIRFASIESIVDEIEHHNSCFNAGSFCFTDDVFTLDEARTVDLCEELESRGLRIHWSATTRADCISQETIDAMKKAGCSYLSFGVESGVEEIRSRAGKDISDKKIMDAFESCRKAGIPSCAHILYGLPGEKLRDMRESMSFVKKLDPTYAIFRLALALPGTRLFEDGVSQGNIEPDAWDVFTENGGQLPIFIPEGVCLREMIDLRELSVKSFYFRKSYVASRLKHKAGLGDILGLPYFLYLVGRFSPDFP